MLSLNARPLPVTTRCERPSSVHVHADGYTLAYVCLHGSFRAHPEFLYIVIYVVGFVSFYHYIARNPQLESVRNVFFFTFLSHTEYVKKESIVIA